MDRQSAAAVVLNSGADFLRYVWCDNSNIIRTKALFLPAFLAYFEGAQDGALLAALEDAVSITAAMQSVPATADAPAPAAGLAPVEDIRLVPAWDTLVETAVPGRDLTVICEMFEGEAAWVHCPRTYLKRQIARLAEQGLGLHIGLELEFYLLHPAEDAESFPRPVDSAVYAQGLAAQISGGVISEMARALWRQGIPVTQYIPEGGPGQQELTLEHCGPLLLADRLVHARQTIHGVALQHDLLASFLPVLFEGAAGSGLHTHMSLWRGGENSTAAALQPWGMAEETNAFVAGILAHLPALMAVTTPTKNSYRRIRPHAWSGAYQAWGIENKEAALRLIKDPASGTPTNVELKTVDGTANPYLALGSIIAAGLDGLQKGLRLPQPVAVDPGDYESEEREARGIRPLPNTLPQALALFAADEALQGAMGAPLAHVFAAVRQAELDSLDDVSFDEERRLLFRRY